MKVFYVFIFLSLCACTGTRTNSTQAPSICDNSLSTRESSRYQESLSKYKRYQFKEALKLAEPVYKKHSHCFEIAFHYAKTLYALRPTESLPIFEGLYQDYEEGKNPDISYTLGLQYYRQKDYRKAMPYLRYTVNEHPSYSNAAKAKSYLQKARTRAAIIGDESQENITIEKLPTAINTSDLEYTPSMTADGKTLLFTRRTNGNEDIYYSRINDEGRWSAALPMPVVNSPANEGAHCISADGKTLIYTFCDHLSNTKTCNLYASYLRDNSWSEPIKLNAPVNTKYWEAQPSLTADGRFLYFVSDRKGSVGKSDIYRAERMPDGSWGNVINLGYDINTGGEESSPHIATDYKTLYFSSDSLIGLGGRDLFMSRMEWSGEWTEPINMGIPFNSEKDDGTIYVSRNGKDAFISSDREDGKQLDLYKVHLRDELRALPTEILRGQVLDKVSQAPLQNAHISVHPIGDSIAIADAMSDEHGQFLFTLPMNFNYSIWGEKEGYLFESIQVKSAYFYEEEKAALTIQLEAVPTAESPEEGTLITLRNIFFETGKSTLLPEAIPELNRALQLFDENPGITVQVLGHTDNVGSAESNYRLSFNRAETVAKWLIEHGVTEGRVTFDGLGETRPVASNETDEGRALNRRTEFLILSGN